MATTQPAASGTDRASAPRSRRAGRQEKVDALLAAAREVFASDGINASLEEVARRAGVGIGTLYRNFPNRQALLEAVYVEEVEALAQVATDLTDHDPGGALTVWLRQFVEYAATKKAIHEALNFDSPLLAACITRIHQAGEPLLADAQRAGAIRGDVSFEDVRHLINGIAGTSFADDAQRERVFTVALDGLARRATKG